MSDDAELNVALIEALCLECGRLMEEASSNLALALPASFAHVTARVDDLCRTAEQVMALATAARALIRFEQAKSLSQQTS